MFQHETSFAFRKRVEDHQLERASVGLSVIPEEELVIGILNRLDMSRYASLTKDYFDNERRGIADLPVASSTLWKEIKDTQIIRFKGTGGGALESVYLSRADDLHIDGGKGRGRGVAQDAVEVAVAAVVVAGRVEEHQRSCLIHHMPHMTVLPLLRTPNL